MAPQLHKKIVVVGDGSCGKTSMLIAFTKNHFDEIYVPTIFENREHELSVDGQTIQLSLWDTAGQESFEALRPLSYPDSDIILICFTVINRDSFENIANAWHPEVQLHCPNVPFLLIGCKSDLVDDATTLQALSEKGQRPVSREDAEGLRDRLGASGFVMCSAKTRHNVALVFETATRVVLKNSSKNAAKKKGCVLL